MMRPAKQCDLNEILSIEGASFDDPWSEEAFLSFMRHPAVHFTVFDIDGKARGYVIYSLICGEAEIYNIAVAPDRRREGLGGSLLDEAVGKADAAFLDVRADNAPAIALYRSRGFERIDVRKNYYGSGEDALVMKWRR